MVRTEHAGHLGRRVLRLAVAVVSVPLYVSAALFASPRVAKADPTSQRLADLRRLGWRPVEVRLEPRRTEVLLVRDDERCTVVGETLPFAAYATLTASRTGAVVGHTT